MAKTCLIAAICATARRANPIRSVSAFTGSSLISSSPSVAARHSAIGGSPAFTRLAMSTEVSSTPQILKRVKTDDAAPTDEDIAIKGWVRTVRKQKTLAFVEVNDGSSLSGIQCVLPFDDINDDTRAGESCMLILLSTVPFRKKSFLMIASLLT
jgi:hypothetical protein